MARPDVASTLAFIIRLIPAMPIAESRAPIVVGIRHTRSAIRTVIVTTDPDPFMMVPKLENGIKVTHTRRKIRVSATSRMVSATSFGVLPRWAPSTIANMRSRKASPGRAVTRTMIQSERTRVPPVTEQKSPPDSRMTGADSPVIADSSTDAAPCMTSPSAGMISPASTRT